MAIATEDIESRSISTSEPPSATLRFHSLDAADQAEAFNAVATAAPALFDYLNTGIFFLPINGINIDPVDNIWTGTVHYGVEPQTQDSSFSFDTGGGNQHITHSRQTIESYGETGFGDPPDFQGAIGATRDSVEGVDITVPVYNFAETHWKPPEFVTDTYKGVVAQLTGKVNSGLFRGLNAGECLFLGASGTQRGSGDWEINYRFAGSPNVDDLAVGPITEIEKDGWDYLWIRYDDAVDESANMLVKRPIAAYIERVYLRANLNQLSI